MLTEARRVESPGIAPAVVEADHACKQFDGRAVISDVSFRVPVGTIIGFIGPSGCGKSTLVRMMTGLYAPTSGAMTVFGKEPTRLTRTQRRGIGYLPQSPVLLGDLSVWHNLNFHASLYGMGLRRKARLREMLELVELDGDRRKRIDQLSGGMRRRVALASALVHDPELVFLDEPTAGIDPILRRKFWEHFRALRDAGRTLIVTTQYVGEAAYCDLVAVLSDGRLLVVDSPDGLRRRAFGDRLDSSGADDDPALADFDEVFIRLIERDRATAEDAA